MGSIAIKCSNCDIRTSLLLRVKTVKEMVTKFLFNTKLYHVGLSWIISSSKQMKYDIKGDNNPGWLNKGPRYITAKILGSVCRSGHQGPLAYSLLGGITPFQSIG